MHDASLLQRQSLKGSAQRRLFTVSSHARPRTEARSGARDPIVFRDVLTAGIPSRDFVSEARDASASRPTVIPGTFPPAASI